MGVGEVVGGAALVGVATLLGLSWTADDEADSGAPTTTVFVWDSTTTSLAPTTTTPTSDGTLPDSIPGVTTEPTSSSAAPDTTAESAPVTTQPVTTPPATTPPATQPPPVTTTPPVETLATTDRANVAVQVVNGSGADGAAAFVTGVLRVSGFNPIEPADAVQLITTPQGVIYYADGEVGAAQTVASVLAYSTEQVVPAPISDPNWLQFGSGIQVLVVLGP